MASISKVLTAVLALCAAAPAAAQYYAPPPPPPPPGPPPGYYQPPPPPPGPPPPGWYGPQAILRNNTLRLSGGMAAASDGYYCGYAFGPGFAYPACGAGYSPVLPNLNVDIDLGLARFHAISVGANVMWGSYGGITNTIWEPHVDYLLRGSPFAPIRGRFRLGFGIYIASATPNNSSGPTSTATGEAFRIGGGVSILADQPVGIGIDAIYEAGSVNGYYVSTVQLLAGPEFHF